MMKDTGNVYLAIGHGVKSAIAMPLTALEKAVMTSIKTN
jgi:hypothetical protein